MEEGFIQDGTVATDLSKVRKHGLYVRTQSSSKGMQHILVGLVSHFLVAQVKALWERRERIAEAVVRDGVTYKVHTDFITIILLVHTHMHMYVSVPYNMGSFYGL